MTQFNRDILIILNRLEDNLSREVTLNTNGSVAYQKLLRQQTQLPIVMWVIT